MPQQRSRHPRQPSQDVITIGKTAKPRNFGKRKSPFGAKPKGLKWKVLEVVATMFAACQCRRRNDIICAVAGRRTMNDLTIAEPIKVDVIRSRIITIRDVQVMLDRDLAELYGVEVGQLNRQVKRNIERFPHDFMFQLSREDCSRCQIGTLNGGRGSNIKYLPYAFTGKGIIKLAFALNSPTAVEASPTSWQRCEQHRKNRQTAKFRKTNFPTCF